jgi:hypothetical protein
VLAPVVLCVLRMLAPRVQQQHFRAAEQLCPSVALAGGISVLEHEGIAKVRKDHRPILSAAADSAAAQPAASVPAAAEGS